MNADATAHAAISGVASLPLAHRRIKPAESSSAGFVGLAPAGPLDRAVRADSFQAFAAAFTDPSRPHAGPFLAGAKLAHAVRGFFRNGGHACWVVRAAGEPGSATVADHLQPGRGLRLLADVAEPTVLAAPDAHDVATRQQGAEDIQRELVAICENLVGRLAIVDPPPDLAAHEVLAWRSASRIDSPAAAAYYPWIEVSDPASGSEIAVPPCGHVAGLLARVDLRSGPHQAPTAEALLATDGATAALTNAEQHDLNRAGLNCLRAWPGPELRVWGACTLSSDSEMRYLHRQRIVGHLVGAIAQGTSWAADEPNDARLHESLRATVTAFLTDSWRDGALQGDTAGQAFFVRCDASLNDAAARARGDVVLEVGLAVRRSGDFRVLRISHHAPVAG